MCHGLTTDEQAALMAVLNDEYQRLLTSISAC